jgi:nitrate reductase delta subunit
MARRMLPRRRMTVDARIEIWSIAAALLRYPEAELLDALDEIQGATQELPVELQDGISNLLDWMQGQPLLELQQQYVETFDFNKRADLHLTYHAHGDKRQRGIVLLRLKRLYGEHGVDIEDGCTELPDYLPMLLEFAAYRPVIGCDTMSRFRAPIELIRRTLGDSGSPYVAIMHAVVATLPPLRGDERDAVRRLLEDGPPEEAVGLEPYAPEQIMPQNEIDSRFVGGQA